jgi:hypothetical protein
VKDADTEPTAPICFKTISIFSNEVLFTPPNFERPIDEYGYLDENVKTERMNTNDLLFQVTFSVYQKSRDVSISRKRY